MAESELSRRVGRPSTGKQTNVRLSEGLLACLDEIGVAHALDLSSVIRMILTDQHPAYLERARKIKADQDATKRKPTKGVR